MTKRKSPVVHPTEVIAIADLKPHPKNEGYRTHPPEQIEHLRQSIRENGVYRNVVIARDNTILAGHGVIEAAQEEGLTEFPVIRLRIGPNDPRALKILVGDNELPKFAITHDDGLVSMLESIRVNDRVGLLGTGFSDDNLDLMIASLDRDKNAPTAETPKPFVLPENPVTQRGDVWEIGPHRIMCGDCRDAADVELVLGGATVNVAVTSPPYAEQRAYDPDSEFQPVPPDEYVEWFSSVSANIAAHLAGDGSFFLNIKPASEGLDTFLYVHDLVAAHVRQWGWHFATEFCWERGGVPKHVKMRFKNQFEPVYQFARGGWKIRPDNVQHISRHAVTAVGRSDAGTDWPALQGTGAPLFTKEQLRGGKKGGRYSGTASAVQGVSGALGNAEEGVGWAYPGNRLPTFSGTHEAVGHSAAFPVGLAEFFIRAYSDEKDVAFDPFVGSGSSVIAAANSNRVGFGLEISPAYVDMALSRLQRATGIVPTRKGKKVDFSVPED